MRGLVVEAETVLVCRCNDLHSSHMPKHSILKASHKQLHLVESQQCVFEGEKAEVVVVGRVAGTEGGVDWVAGTEEVTEAEV